MLLNLLSVLVLLPCFPAFADNIRWDALSLSNLTATFPAHPRSFCGGKLPPPEQLQNFFSEQPVFLSITTISSRVGGVGQIVCNFLIGAVTPTHIFVVVSDSSYLLDKGIPIRKLPSDLVSLALYYSGFVSIVYTGNTGPHRKLLPILSHYTHEANVDERDVIIITFDDDFKWNFSFRYAVSELLKYYVATGRNSVVALRTRRIGLCYQNADAGMRYLWKNVSLYKGWNCCNRHDVTPGEMLVLPTGTGGVLYRPHYFHPVVFDPQFRQLTATNDDITFRLASMIRGVQVVTACRELGHLKTGDYALSARGSGAIDVTAESVQPMSFVRTCPDVVSFALPSINVDRVLPTASHRQLLGGAPAGLWEQLNGGQRKTKSGGAASNALSNNDVMWRDAIEYLNNKSLFNFKSDIIDKYAEAERGSCRVKLNHMLKYRGMSGLHKNCSLYLCNRPYRSSGEVNKIL